MNEWMDIPEAASSRRQTWRMGAPRCDAAIRLGQNKQLHARLYILRRYWKVLCKWRSERLFSILSNRRQRRRKKMPHVEPRRGDRKLLNRRRKDGKNGWTLAGASNDDANVKPEFPSITYFSLLPSISKSHKYQPAELDLTGSVGYVRIWVCVCVCVLVGSAKWWILNHKHRNRGESTANASTRIHYTRWEVQPREDSRCSTINASKEGEDFLPYLHTLETKFDRIALSDRAFGTHHVMPGVPRQPWANTRLLSSRGCFNS